LSIILLSQVEAVLTHLAEMLVVLVVLVLVDFVVL
jgi:hypothetical protein